MTAARKFPIGKPIKEAGLTILKRKGTQATTKLTEYYIKYLCCGARKWLNHTQICKRIRSGQVRCKQCGANKRKHNPRKPAAHYAAENSRDFKPLQFPMPTWDLPSWSLKLKELHDTAISRRKPYV